MKYFPAILLILLILLIFMISACGSVNDLYGYQPYIVDKISEDEYRIIFHGTEHTSQDEAREAWDHRANGTCQGTYQFLTIKEFKNFKAGKQKEKFTLCPRGDDLNCIPTDKHYGDATSKTHFDVIGMAMCIDFSSE